jgi:hypothetical protein
MEKKAEVKKFTLLVEKPAPNAIQAYTATSSSARINVTVVVPSGPEGTKGFLASSAV